MPQTMRQPRQESQRLVARSSSEMPGLALGQVVRRVLLLVLQSRAMPTGRFEILK